MTIREIHRYEFSCDGRRAGDGSVCLNSRQIEAHDEGHAGRLMELLGWRPHKAAGWGWLCAAPAGHEGTPAGQPLSLPDRLRVAAATINEAQTRGFNGEQLRGLDNLASQLREVANRWDAQPSAPTDPQPNSNS